MRTAGDVTPRTRARSPERPLAVPSARRRAREEAPSPTGAGARLLAPLALVICAIAVFSVINGGGSNKPATGSHVVKSGAKHSSSATHGAASGASTPSGAVVPAKATYRVKPGDSFAAIAQTTGVSADKLAQLNPGVDPRALQPGQKLKLK